MTRGSEVSIPCKDVVARADARAINPDTVADLKKSMSGAIGMIYPIVVRRRQIWQMSHWGDGYELIAGRHRHRAAIDLGWENIRAVVIEAGDIDAELTMIAENLHRSELTALERDEQIDRWIRLTEVADGVSAQIAPKLGRPESGINAASRALAIERTDAQRATKVAALSPEAKEAARNLGLDDNRSALLTAAKESEPEKQVATLSQYRHLHRKRADKEAQRRRFWLMWASLDEEVRQSIMADIKADRIPKP